MVPSKIKEFMKNHPNIETPFLVFDLSVLKDKYKEFKTQFPKYHVFYAVKCNPAKQVITTLNSLGSSFDVASIEEVDLCLSANVAPEKISWGSPIKKASLIKDAYNKGVNIYAFDSEEELVKLAENAPRSKVFCRILVNNANAMWPLSAKFGCNEVMAKDLMIKAKELGLIPYGISFHVGSQQIDLSAWERAITQSSHIFKELKTKHNINLEMLNIGGGYPSYGYITEYKPLSQYQEVINAALKKEFADNIPTIFTEPGRFLVADAGVLKTEVILVSKKQYNTNERWVYLDIGMFGGLAETMGESIKYHIISDKENEEKDIVNLAGPTCDGVDVLYKDYKYKLPVSLKSGDYLYMLSTGGYTTSYSSVCFNGFKPLKDYYID